jgi:hypothetical protein
VTEHDIGADLPPDDPEAEDDFPHNIERAMERIEAKADLVANLIKERFGPRS